MGSTLNQKLNSLPQARQKDVAQRTAELIEHELSLRDLRKAMRYTQADLARKMQVGQDAVSRYEQRTDMMLSTLERYVSAMGGRLTLVAEFPNRQPVRLNTLGELSRGKPGAAGEGTPKTSRRRPAKRS